jgi:4'-phosphopantetheinyl transferase
MPDTPPAADEVVLWRLSFLRSAAEQAQAEAVLAEEERARAGRFIRPADRTAFVLQRGALRLILQRLLGIPAGQLRFSVGEWGKPAVADNPGAPEFNVSGSGEWGLLAFAGAFAVGVDLEVHREVDYLELGRQVFAAEEMAQLAALPPSDRAAGFFAGWSRKEAFIKALGMGLYFPLDQFAVSLRPDEPARVLAVKGNRTLAQEWTLADLSVAPGYSAAVAAQARFTRVRRCEVPDLRKLALD